jgi:hypothetical protein
VTTLATYAALYLLHVFDAACSGYRDAAGRDARIRKRPYYRQALLRGAVAGHLVVLVMGALWVALVVASPDRVGLLADLARAAGAAFAVYVPYALVIAAALALRAVPSVDGRSLLSVLVFGPLLVLRPIVALGGVAYAWWRVPRLEVAVLGLTAVVLALAVEPLLGRLRRA